jgi:hypothetical protein
MGISLGWRSVVVAYAALDCKGDPRGATVPRFAAQELPVRRLLCVAILCCLTSAAWARPAVVRVFEAQVRANPGAGSEVVAVLVEGQQISVAEKSENGWRRVRLADGKTAWIDDASLFLPEPLPQGVAKPVAGQPVGPTLGSTAVQFPVAGLAPGVVAPPPERPFKVVADLEGLRAALANEPALLPQVAALEASERTSNWIFYSGLAAGVLLAVTPQVVNAIRDKGPEPAWLYVGGAVLLGTQVGAWWTSVGEEEMAPIIGSYNERHAETPLKYEER